MDEERWAEITGGFKVSTFGRVERLSYMTDVYEYSAGPLQPNGDREGYLHVSLRQQGTATVHSLVMLAFVGPRPEGMHINHLNGIRSDNRLENLEYCTPLENTRHARARSAFQWHGADNSNFKGAVRGKHKKTGQCITLEGKRAILDAGFRPNCIYECLSGKQASHRGYVWERVV